VRASPRHTPVGSLAVIYDSHQPEYIKIPPQTGGSSYFLIEKSPKTAFFKYENLLIILIHFVRKRSRIKRIFYFRPF
jgi:hypothetical protein